MKVKRAAAVIGWVGVVVSMGCGGRCSGPDRTAPAKDPTPSLRFEPLESMGGALTGAPLAEKRALKNLSDAVVLRDGSTVVVSDEGLEFVVADPGRTARAVDLTRLLSEEQKAAIAGAPPSEIDLEGATDDGPHALLTGSASLKRPKKTRPDGSLVPASGEGSFYSDFAYWIEFEGEDLRVARVANLRALLVALPELAPFAGRASKENGIDVEAIATLDGAYYVGLRGPVRDGNRAAIVRFSDLAPGAASLVIDVDLAGLGVRGLARRPAGGLFVLAGPVDGARDPFVLFAWDTTSAPKRLGAVRMAHGDANPEGIFVHGSDLCVIADGEKGGAPMCIALSALPN